MKKLFLILALSFSLLTACDVKPTDNTVKPDDTVTPPAVSAVPHQLGNADAPVLVEEFSDPQCPACGAISPQVEKVIRENPDVARLEYYHFPLPYHEFAFISAEATECAADQGKFFEFLGTIFANQSSLTEDYLYNVADSLKLDRPTFDSCLKNHEHKALVLADMEAGNKRQIPGTPTLFVNGKMIKWSDAETFTGYLKSLAAPK